MRLWGGLGAAGAPAGAICGEGTCPGWADRALSRGKGELGSAGVAGPSWWRAPSGLWALDSPGGWGLLGPGARRGIPFKSRYRLASLVPLDGGR